jgi:chromatin assembly factor 1 subunit A
MQRYQKELDKKLKKYDEPEEIIETWGDRAKRIEKERKEAERKKKEEEREAEKEIERNKKEEERKQRIYESYDPSMTMDELEALKKAYWIGE